MAKTQQYKRIKSATATQDGVPVTLALQQRLDIPPCPFFTVSWRTLYKPGGMNRRFYLAKDGVGWHLSLAVAQDLLDRAERDGMLDHRFDDKYERFGGGVPTFICSSAITSPERERLWHEITLDGREPDWGTEPSFVVADEYSGRWRKVMIVDSDKRVVTFRSCTTEAGYALGVTLPGTPEWRLDNAMQDAGTAITRRFLDFLRSGA